MKQLIIFFLLTLTLFSSCDEQRRYVKRMVGTWNIVQEDVRRINSDGTVDREATNLQIGTLLLTEPDFSAILIDYSITFPGANFSRSGYGFKTDENAKRVFLYNFFCDDIYNCDWVGTIEEDETDRQVWTFYRGTTGANGAPAHWKYTWTLERE